MKKVEKADKKEPLSLVMKAHAQNITLSNSGVNFRFVNELGAELIKGTATQDHIEALNKSIEGLEDFIDLLKEKIQETKNK